MRQFIQNTIIACVISQSSTSFLGNFLPVKERKTFSMLWITKRQLWRRGPDWPNNSIDNIWHGIEYREVKKYNLIITVLAPMIVAIAI